MVTALITWRVTTLKRDFFGNRCSSSSTTKSSFEISKVLLPLKNLPKVPELTKSAMLKASRLAASLISPPADE